MAEHGKAPVWLVETGHLVCVDMLAGDILTTDAEGALVERRHVRVVAAAVRMNDGVCDTQGRMLRCTMAYDDGPWYKHAAIVEGKIWVALRATLAVHRYNAQGLLTSVVTLPAHRVTA